MWPPHLTPRTGTPDTPGNAQVSPRSPSPPPPPITTPIHNLLPLLLQGLPIPGKGLAIRYGEGGGATKRRGVVSKCEKEKSEVLPLQKKEREWGGGAEKVLAMLKGVGVGGKTLFEVVLRQELEVSPLARGGGCFCLLQRLMALV